MNDIAIQVENLSKLYRIGALKPGERSLRETVTDTLTMPFRRLSSLVLRPFAPLRAGSSSDGDGGRKTNDAWIWALKDVSFEVKRGEVVGIIGRNGAGKTTLLKILSRITEPTEGRAEIHGRVGSLLEVGTGFHPELTGRENIYLNGAILGMKRAEIERKFAEIVAFAEIEKFIDTPVKRYSSGMYVRLAFAVAAHLEPEILLVDEVLAVGDAAFQKKCLGKMGDVAKEGRTVLFVSHNMGAVQQLCLRAVLLNEGQLLLDDLPGTVVSRYLSMGTQHISERVWPDIEHAPGDDVARLCAVRVLDQHGNVCTQFDVRYPVYVEMEYCIFRDLDYLDASYYFYNERGELVFVSADDSFDSPAGGRPRPAGRYRATCHIPPDFLNEGQLYVQAALTQERRVHTIQRDVVMFQVGDAMDRQGVRGNYHDGVWPPAAVRPRLRWTSNRTPLEPEKP